MDGSGSTILRLRGITSRGKNALYAHVEAFAHTAQLLTGHDPLVAITALTGSICYSSPNASLYQSPSAIMKVRDLRFRLLRLLHVSLPKFLQSISKFTWVLLGK